MSLLDTLDGELQEEQQVSVKKDLSPVQDAGDYVIVRDIECVDAYDNVFERYDEVWVPKAVEKDHAGEAMSFLPYNGIVHFEEKGSNWSLPSAALTLNLILKILPRAVMKRSDGEYDVIDEELKKILDGYHCESAEDGCGCGIHLQNSVVLYDLGQIVHYPGISDFIQNGSDGKTGIRLDFDRTKVGDCTISEGIDQKGTRHFLRQFSGVKDLGKLLELEDYYNWLSDNEIGLNFPWLDKADEYGVRPQSVSIGGDYFSFSFAANGRLDLGELARGVRLR